MLYFSRQGPLTGALVTTVIFTLGWAGAMGWVHAQPAGSVQLNPLPTLQASAPNTPVPPVLYHSPLAGLPTGIEPSTLDWKAANAAVGQFKRGHADLLQWEEAQARQQATPKPPAMVCCKGAAP